MMSDAENPAGSRNSPGNNDSVLYKLTSAVALFAYDYLTTFGDELTFVWRRPKGLGTVLYLLTRYPAFVDLSLRVYYTITLRVSQHQCTVLLMVLGYSFLGGICVAETIMSIRVWALWGRARSIAILLGVPWIAAVGSATSFLRDSLVAAPHMPRCHSLNPYKAFVAFAILMSFETVILALTLVKCLSRSRLHASRLMRPSSLFDLFIRDGAIYFVCLFAVSFINTLALHGDLAWQLNFTAFQRSLHSVLSSRIFIHIRRSPSTTSAGANAGSSSPYGIHSDGVDTIPLAHFLRQRNAHLYISSTNHYLSPFLKCEILNGQARISIRLRDIHTFNV
ncbi:hypothetical protein AB1N83_009383 [Pleurotus pulmonarius]